LKIGIAGSRIASKLAAARDDAISIAPSAKFEFMKFIGSLPITAIPGLSARKIEKLQHLGIGQVGQILENRGLISFRFSKPFMFWLFSAALGIDHFFTVRPISVEVDLPVSTNFAEISGRLRILCQKLALRIEQSNIPAKFMKVSFVAAEGKSVTKCTTFQYSSMEFCDIYAAADSLIKNILEMSHCGLAHVKVSVSDREFIQRRTQQTLGKWVEKVTEHPKPIKLKKTVLEDFFATTSGSQEIPSLPHPKKKFRPKRPLSARSHLTQRTLI
jgi:nucleotidyltransferase/DNA polymerase involved in DNA repair